MYSLQGRDQLIGVLTLQLLQPGAESSLTNQCLSHNMGSKLGLAIVKLYHYHDSTGTYDDSEYYHIVDISKHIAITSWYDRLQVGIKTCSRYAQKTRYKHAQQTKQVHKTSQVKRTIVLVITDYRQLTGWLWRTIIADYIEVVAGDHISVVKDLTHCQQSSQVQIHEAHLCIQTR